MSIGGTSGGLVRHRRRFWTPVAGGAIPEQRRRETAKATGLRGLRRRRPKDLAACARLLRVVHYESHYPEQWPETPRAWLDADVLDAWVVERQDEILGHVAISPVGQETISAYRWREMTGHEPSELATVSRLFVRRRARHGGIGTALLEAAVGEIRARGLVPVLQVVDQHQDAVQLCQALGWRLLSMDQCGARGERKRIHCYAAPPKPAG